MHYAFSMLAPPPYPADTPRSEVALPVGAGSLPWRVARMVWIPLRTRALISSGMDLDTLNKLPHGGQELE